MRKKGALSIEMVIVLVLLIALAVGVGIFYSGLGGKILNLLSRAINMFRFGN